MKKIIITLILICSAVFLSCEEENKKDKEEQSAVEESVIKLPSCISEKNSSKRAGSSSIETTIKNVYDPIRWTLYSIDEWSKTATEVTKFIEEDILPNAESGNWKNEDPVDDNDVQRIIWGAADGTDYDTKVEVYYLINDEETKGLEVYLTIDGDRAKGQMTFDLENTPNDAQETAKLTIIFDGTESTKTMTFKAADMNNNDTTGDEPSKVIAKAWLDSNNIFKVSASYFYPTFTLDDEDSATTEERTYTFTIVGYDEVGIDSERKNKAIMKLAVPTMAADTATLFTDYSIGKVFKDHFYSKLKTDLATDDDGSTLTIEDYESWTKLDFTGSGSTENFTDDDLYKLLTWAIDQDDDTGLEEFLFLIKLVNPAYFAGKEGFEGTFDGTEGTLSAIPSWVDSSQLDIDSLDSEIIAPGTVKALSFDETDFAVK